MPRRYPGSVSSASSPEPSRSESCVDRVVRRSIASGSLQAGASLPVALTQGFKGGFVVAAGMCALALVVAAAALPGRPRKIDAAEAELTALASSCCPAAPQSGHLTRVAAGE